MKKLLFLLLVSFLVLGACGNKEENKSEDKKETKASDKESKKDNEKSNKEKDKSDDKSNEKVADKESLEQENTQEQVNTQYQPVQSQEKPQYEEQQNSQDGNNEQSNIPAGDAMFGEYKDDGSYCTVGGCLTPEQQKDQEEANYEEMENQGYSREEYDEIQNKAAELQQQRDKGEISSEEFTDSYLELYD
ncbi:hypothetical protein NGC55_01155 [Staphylococcus xylosus]|uniref:hypothetical protein n=1 Tax=Staphylococcus xylosus TaxID=1288 RepID=UPI002DB81123|nr:hypothetical protein [Staphylococcus xylosus]MEB7383487.1 hypothetical protein [Staphylococcus xylosus]